MTDRDNCTIYCMTRRIFSLRYSTLQLGVQFGRSLGTRTERSRVTTTMREPIVFERAEGLGFRGRWQD